MYLIFISAHRYKFLNSERFFSSIDEANNIDSVIYAIWYRKKGEEYKKYYPTLSNKSSKKRIPFWRTLLKDERMAWGGAGHIYCRYDKKLDKVVMDAGHDFGYWGGNQCHLTVKCEEKYFFDGPFIWSPNCCFDCVRS